jgi:starvation-inducible DNA-binding protein
LFRLLEAHEVIIAETREAAEAASQSEDQGTNDLLVSEILRTNEFQVWFISEQLAGTGISDKVGESMAEPVGVGSRHS